MPHGRLISEAQYDEKYNYVQITHTVRTSTVCYFYVFTLCTKPTQIWQTKTLHNEKLRKCWWGKSEFLFLTNSVIYYRTERGLNDLQRPAPSRK
jgi:hypothetical protein